MQQYLHKRDTDYVRDNLIFNYCLGNEQELLIESYVHNNNIDIRFDKKHFYFLMTGAHKKFIKPHTPETFSVGVTSIYAMYDSLTAVLHENGFDGNVFLIKEDNSKQTGIIFSPVSPSGSAERVAGLLQQKYLSLSPNRTAYGEHVSTSLVGPYSGYEQINRAFLDARELNDLLFFGVRDRVITKEFREKTARPCDITAILANVRRLTNTLCFGTCKEALKQMDMLITSMVAPSYSMLNFGALWAAFEDVMNMFETVYPDHVKICHRPLMSFFTLSQYKAWAHETICRLFDQLQNARRYSPTILMALSHINRSYTSDLSLTQLSEYVYTNPSSLSSEFNDAVGMSLSEYVTQLRIAHAKKLLESTALSVPEIAKAVGFSSAKYFREIFKKQTGVSPQQYKDQ